MPRNTCDPNDEILYNRNKFAIATDKDANGFQVIVVKGNQAGGRPFDLEVDQGNPQRDWNHTIQVLRGIVKFGGDTYTANTSHDNFKIQNPANVVQNFKAIGDLVVLFIDGKDSPPGTIRTNPINP